MERGGLSAESAAAVQGPVCVHRDGAVAVVEVRNPPVNALSQSVRSGLLDAFAGLAGDASVLAIVLRGASGRFVAGADIKELASPPAEPALRDVLAAIDRCPQVVIAAIEGAALGGGLELALACDWRLADAAARVGLPEVKIGIIPGAGGTQRLPRLIGVSNALRLIVDGQALAAPEALALGVIDQVVDTSASEAAIALAHAPDVRQRVRKRRLSEAAPVREPLEQLEQAAQEAQRKGRGQPAIEAAIEAVRQSALKPFPEGMSVERQLFLELRDSAQAGALRHLFFAERAAAKVPGVGDAVSRALNGVGVIGSGTMGSGIVVALAAAGLDVVLIERDAPALEAGLARIERILAQTVASKRLSAEAAQQRRARVRGSTDYRALANCDLVIEAAFEDIEVKKDIFKRVVEVVPPGVVLATNTSFIDVDLIASATPRAADTLGLHFFSPAHVMKLLEVVRGRETSSTALATGLALARRLGKLPVVAGVCDGFIGNRISQAYRRQCEFMLEEGATPEQVDQALEAFGFAMGPFAVSDMAGLDISWARRKAFASARDPRERYVDVADTLCEGGRFGQKTGAGWYAYPNGGRQRQPDQAVTRLVEAASTKRGLTRRPFDAAEIQHRALAGMVVEAALVLEDGIAQRPSDIDLVFVHGYGFPAVKGGPLFWASHQPPEQLRRWIACVEEATGFGFREPAHLDQVWKAYQI